MRSIVGTLSPSEANQSPDEVSSTGSCETAVKDQGYDFDPNYLQGTFWGNGDLPGSVKFGVAVESIEKKDYINGPNYHSPSRALPPIAGRRAAEWVAARPVASTNLNPLLFVELDSEDVMIVSMSENPRLINNSVVRHVSTKAAIKEEREVAARLIKNGGLLDQPVDLSSG
jgi:hypothetical protein